MEKKKAKKRKNQTDSTLRNVRAANKKLAHLNAEVTKPIRFAFLLIEVFKSKRLLTPAQVKMLEDALR